MIRRIVAGAFDSRRFALEAAAKTGAKVETEPSTDGKLSGRGTPYLREVVCGLMTVAGGNGHMLPYLIPNLYTATVIAAAVVVLELLAIAFIHGAIKRRRSISERRYFIDPSDLTHASR